MLGLLLTLLATLLLLVISQSAWICDASLTLLCLCVVYCRLRYLAESKLVRCLAVVLVPNTLQGAGMGDYLFYYLQTYLGYGTAQNAWQVRFEVHFEAKAENRL